MSPGRSFSDPPPHGSLSPKLVWCLGRPGMHARPHTHTHPGTHTYKADQLGSGVYVRIRMRLENGVCVGGWGVVTTQTFIPSSSAWQFNFAKRVWVGVSLGGEAPQPVSRTSRFSHTHTPFRRQAAPGAPPHPIGRSATWRARAGEPVPPPCLCLFQLPPTLSPPNPAPPANTPPLRLVASLGALGKCWPARLLSPRLTFLPGGGVGGGDRLARKGGLAGGGEEEEEEEEPSKRAPPPAQGANRSLELARRPRPLSRPGGMSTCDAKEYLAKREIPQLFESLLNGLMCYKPDDPVEYLEGCLQKVKELGGAEKVKWDTFVSPEKRTLPPLNGSQSRRAFFRNVMPDNPNFPYRRYERLPPIQQFSIESDTDLSETAELIEEYDVFDPARPRPKIILVIGGPGSGKGTQSLKIADRYGFEYISVGELLRKKIHNTSSNRKWSLIAKIITTGELAPQETTITEIKQRLMQIPDEEGIVIDGFPRDVAQALSFEDQICTPDLVVFLSCSNQRLKERLMKRAEQQGRPDDNLKATQRRLTNFKQNAVPLVKYFQEKGLIMTFDADRDEEEVFKDISTAVDSKLFPPQEPVAGPCELDLNLIGDPEDVADNAFDFEDQAYDQSCLCGPANAEDFSEDLKKSHIFFIVGGPGSGKGTLCEKLAQKYGFQHLSAEELMRHEMPSLMERSKTIRDTMETGELVPEDVVLELLKEAMFASAGDTKGFLMDGFPQELKQGEEFESQIGEPSLMLCLDCSSATMSSRLLEGSQSSQGLDNSGEAITKRIEAYYQANEPVVTYYKNRIPLFKVNAEGTPEEVFLETCAIIDVFLKKEGTGSPLLAHTV